MKHILTLAFSMVCLLAHGNDVVNKITPCDVIESAYDAAVAAINSAPTEQRQNYAKAMAACLADITTGWIAMSSGVGKTLAEESNRDVVLFTYGTFLGDLARLQKALRSGDTSARALMKDRVDKIVNFYPISVPVIFDEEISVVLFLSRAADDIREEVLAIVSNRIRSTHDTERLALLVVLAGLGDETASKNLMKLKSEKANTMIRVFQTHVERREQKEMPRRTFPE